MSASWPAPVARRAKEETSEKGERGGRPTAVRRARGAASERETPRRGRGLRRVVPSDRPPPGGVSDRGTPLAAPSRVPTALPVVRAGPEGESPGRPRWCRRALPALPLSGEGRGPRVGPLRAGRASVPVAATRCEGVVARALRRRDEGFPRRRWLGRDPSFPGRGSTGRPPSRASEPPALGCSPPPAASARRPSATLPPPLSCFVRPSFRPSLRPRAGPRGPARLPLLSPSGASDRSEGNFRRPEGWRGGRPLRPFSARGVPFRARSARRPAEAGVGGVAVAAPEGSASFRAASFPPQTRGPGTRDVRPLLGGSAAVQSLELPRVARPGTGELRLDSLRPPRRPRGLPSGGVPGRAERPVLYALKPSRLRLVLFIFPWAGAPRHGLTDSDNS